MPEWLRILPVTDHETNKLVPQSPFWSQSLVIRARVLLDLDRHPCLRVGVFNLPGDEEKLEYRDIPCLFLEAEAREPEP